ncbi:uncharacterized protein LOC102806436 [Saccoglossus kowalevskii]
MVIPKSHRVFLSGAVETPADHLTTASKFKLTAGETDNMLVANLANAYGIEYCLGDVGPIGLVEKKYSTKERLNVHLSSSRDSETPSINGLINKEDFSLTYVEVDVAIAAINKAGAGAMLCKTDIVDAFKLIPIHPYLWHLYGIYWQLSYFARLAFGCHSSPKIFDHLSSAICWIAENNYGIKTIFHLLDDFLTVDLPNAEAERTMAVLTLIFKRLGIPLAPHKTVGPSCTIEYLGINTCMHGSHGQISSHPRNVTYIYQPQNLHKVQPFESVRPFVTGRTFISRLIELSKGVKCFHHFVTLSTEAKQDLFMWQRLLANWNGISMFLDVHTTPSSSMELFTDASGVGYGGYYQGQWFQAPWSNELLLENDPTQELYPIVAACFLWGKHWCCKRVLFHCDNLAVVNIINKSLAIMKLMHRLVILAATDSFTFQAEHIH